MNSFLIVRLGSLGDVVHGIPVAAALRHEFPNARVDWMVDPRYIELLNLVKGIDRRIGVDPRAIKHGAVGYLTKDISADTLVAAVRKAAAGGKHITPELAEKLVSAIGGGDMAPHEALSDRELEVLRLLASGEKLVHIAEILHLSPSTVTTYRARILEKTGMDSNAKLARYALENGLLT